MSLNLYSRQQHMRNMFLLQPGQEVIISFKRQNTKREQNLPPSNMSLCHKDYFELVFFLKKKKSSRYRRHPENQVEEIIFIRDICIYKENLHLLGCLLSVQGREERLNF